MLEVDQSDEVMGKIFFIFFLLEKKEKGKAELALMRGEVVALDSLGLGLSLARERERERDFIC